MDYAIDYKEIDDVDVIMCALIHEASEDVVRVVCNGTSFEIPESPLTTSNIWFWFYIFLYIFLMLMSGVFSGLVLGLVTIDLTILKVLKDAGPPKVRKYATKITPLVENRHLLLVTLLLANAICMEALPLCLDRVSDPLTAIFVSVTTVLFFGEVIPQAICARYGLAIGATLTPFVYFLMGLMFIVAYPISKLLDFMLGKGHGTFYRRDELKALVSLHAVNEPLDCGGNMQQEFLTRDEVLIIQGALDLKEKKVDTCMIPLEDVFMLSMDTAVNNDTLNQILKSSLSHIPIYDRCRNNVQGILVVKCMIRLSATDRLMVKHLVDTKAFRKPTFVSSDTSLLELLNHFQDGRGYFSFVTKADDFTMSVDNKSCHQWCEMKEKAAVIQGEGSPCGENGLVIGIVTMTDVIQDLLQRDLFSDTDTLQSSINSALQVALAKLSIRRNASSSSLGQLYNYHHHSYNDEIVPSPTCAVSLMDNIVGQTTRK